MSAIPQGAFASYKIRAYANANANKGGYQEKKKDEDSKGFSWGKKTPKEQYNFPQFNQERKIVIKIYFWRFNDFYFFIFSPRAATGEV